MSLEVAIHGRPFNEESIPFLQYMFDLLGKKGINFHLHQSYKQLLRKNHIQVSEAPVYTSKDDFPNVQFVLSVGGDGTLLEALTYIDKKEIPVLGINMGRLGFLATTTKEEIENSLDSLINGEYKVNSRSLIALDNGLDLFHGLNYGANELVIQKRDTSSMIVVHTYVDEEYLNSYWADGLIVSTPTGSTGYSLSCGGPLVTPGSGNFIIAPISPHNLNVRPLIVSDRCKISFDVETRASNFLISFDSRSVKVPAQTRIAVKKADFSLKMVELKNYNYFNTLRNKLNWGLDLRN